MGGAPVRGYTSREIYNTFGSLTQTSENAVLGSIYRDSGNDLTIDSDDKYNPSWEFASLLAGETKLTVVAQNPNENFNAGIAICSSSSASFDDLTVHGYSRTGTLELTGLSSGTYFLSIWNCGYGASFQWVAGAYSDYSKVPTPVISTDRYGKFTISCSDSNATIYWRVAKLKDGSGGVVSWNPDQLWTEYDSTLPRLPLSPNAVIQAIATRDGYWDSDIHEQDSEVKLLTPTISLTNVGGNRYATFLTNDIVNGLQFKYQINTGTVYTWISTDPPVSVAKPNYIEVWTTHPNGMYEDSDRASVTVY